MYMYTFDHSTISWAPQTVASVFLLVNFMCFFLRFTVEISKEAGSQWG